MTRTVKDPDERKREILDTAMRLFAERSVEAVSMRDIAREAGITAGLCYHYFDSKRKLFDVALEAYAEECVSGYLQVLDDTGLTFDEKMDVLFDSVADEESMRYHEFFHAEGNQAFHQQLAFVLCDRMRPHLVAALKADARKRGMRVRAPEVLADFVAHGMVNILSDEHMPDPEKLALVHDYVRVLMESQTEPLA